MSPGGGPPISPPGGGPPMPPGGGPASALTAQTVIRRDRINKIEKIRFFMMNPPKKIKMVIYYTHFCSYASCKLHFSE